jgi:hypothetical protein
MGRIKRFDVKYTFVYFAGLLRAIPYGLDIVRRSRKCHATAVLTNLGRVLDGQSLPTTGGRVCSGGLIVDHVHLVCPIRPKTNLAISVIHYADELQIATHFDARVITSKEVEELIDQWLAALTRIAQDCLEAPAGGKLH